MSTTTTSRPVTARERSEFTQRLMGLLPIQRRALTPLRASEHYAAVIAMHSAEVADDLACALGGAHREPVSFHEIAVRDTDKLDTHGRGARHRKPGRPCSDVERPREGRTQAARRVLGQS